LKFRNILTFANVGAVLQNWFNKNIWNVSKRNWYDAIMDANANIINSFYAYDNLADEIVTPRNALKNTTVYTCVNVRGNTIASLPCNVIQESNKKKEVLTDHPAYYLISQEPNPYMSAANFWKTVMLHVDIWGNGYAYIKRDSRQNPYELHIWEPWEVSVTFQDGDYYYHYQGEVIPSRDILHYRFYSFDGVCGRSPVHENSNAIGMAMKLDRYSAILMGVQPPGILSTDRSLTPEQKAQNKTAWQSATPGSIRVLDGGFKYQPVMTPSDESAFAVQRRQNKTELCGIWQMPPTFVQDFERATFSNAEQMDLVYAKHTVTPICRNIELENNMKLFFQKEKANTYTKFNMNGLLRGDIAARQAFYQSMVNTGVMNRNEARNLEDLNPYEDGDNFLVQGAMVPADLMREKYEKELLAPVEQTPPLTKKLNGNHIYQ
jgi:HK97 family phage portal protein